MSHSVGAGLKSMEKVSRIIRMAPYDISALLFTFITTVAFIDTKKSNRKTTRNSKNFATYGL